MDATINAGHARALTEALALALPPIAVCLTDQAPAGVPAFDGRVPAGCRFWQEAARGPIVTAARDHDLCAIGTFTHNLESTPALEADRADTLRLFAELGYVRPDDIPLIPTLARRPRHVVYGPLAVIAQVPDVVLLFVRASQALVLAEAFESLERGHAPAMGRPACAVVPQVANSGRGAFSLGCCGARAYLDAFTDDVALYAIPGPRLAAYTARIGELAQANGILARFHALRRRDVEGGASPTIKASFARLSAGA